MNLLVTPPEWATTDDARAFWLGLGVGVMVRLVRAAMRWFRRVGDDLPPAP